MKKIVTFLLSMFFSILAFAATVNWPLEAGMTTVDPPVLVVSVVASPSFGNVIIEQNLNNTIELYTNGTCNAVSNATCEGGSQQGIISFLANPNNANPIDLISISVDQNDWPIAGGMLSLGVGGEGVTPGSYALSINPVFFSSNPPLGTCGVSLVPGGDCDIFIGSLLANIMDTEGDYETAPIVLTVEYNVPPF